MVEYLPEEQEYQLEWIVFELCGDEPEEGTAQQLDRLGTLMLELFGHAVVRRISRRRYCHRLQQIMNTVSVASLIHAGIFREAMRAFVSAALVGLDEDFRLGLFFWWILTAIGQQWDHADLRAIGDDLARAMSAHGYDWIFRLVAGQENLSETDECHFFFDELAVFARDAKSSAALVDRERLSFRLFVRSRWTFSMCSFTIKPPSDQPELFLQSNSCQDIEWAKLMRVS